MHVRSLQDPQTPVPSSEIGAAKYFSLADYKKELQQAPGLLIAFEKLREDGLVD